VSERPEDEQREPEEVAPPAEEPAAEEPAAQETPPAEEAAAEGAPPDEEADVPPATAEPPLTDEPPQPRAAEEEVAPVARETPEIPGADLEPDIPGAGLEPDIPGAGLDPDIVAEGEQYLDLEAQAAAEAEAEAAAQEPDEPEEEEARPIAHAAIDLGAGARYMATGKRKTAVARVILKPGTGSYVINGKPLETFFPRETLGRVIRQPLETVGFQARMDVVARMHGGGVSAQAGALRHGIARALIEADPNLRSELKRRGFLTRDPRVKERKKAGLKKARKRPQFSKR